MDGDQVRAAFAATLVSLTHTQGALVRFMSHFRDVQLGQHPDVPFSDVIDEWQRASDSLEEAARIAFGPEGIPTPSGGDLSSE